jgi:hypothetical protein
MLRGFEFWKFPMDSINYLDLIKFCLIAYDTAKAMACFVVASVS